jgi:hypothetical protein
MQLSETQTQNQMHKLHLRLVKHNRALRALLPKVASDTQVSDCVGQCHGDPTFTAQFP